MGIFQSALSSSAAVNRDITLTKVKIIYASNSSSTLVNVWAKNIGTTPITGLDKVDVYFGQMNYVQRIPYNQTSGPTWIYSSPVQIWQPKDTLEFNVTSSSTLAKDTTYVARIAAPNGVADDYIFSIS
jgi:flagellar protein FlaG